MSADTQLIVDAVALSGMRQACLIVDAMALTVLSANPAAQTLLKLRAEQLLGSSVLDLPGTPEDFIYWSQAKDLATLPDPTAWREHRLCTDTVVVTATGECVPVMRQIQPMFTTEGQRAYLISLIDQSAYRAREQQLENLVGELTATLESTTDAVMVVNLRGCVQSYNRSFDRLWKLPPSLREQRNDSALIGHLRGMLIDPEPLFDRIRQMRTQPMMEARHQLRLADGRVFEAASVPQLRRGEAIGRVYTFQDITERLATKQRLQVAAKVFDSSLDAIFVSDGHHRLSTVNPSCAQLFQRSAAELQGIPLSEVLHVPGSNDGLAHILSRLPQIQRWSGELHHRRRDGSTVALHVSLVSHDVGSSLSGPAQGCIGHAHDLTEHLADKRRLSELSLRDALTGLPNRVALAAHIQEFITRSQEAAQVQQPLALLYLDLDRFKYINDTLGPAQADQVLVQVVHRVQSCMREGDYLSRMVGDEFAIALHPADAHLCEVMGGRILEALSQPFQHKETHFFLSASIGAALYPHDALTANDLIKCADDAMHRVKESGRSSLRFYQRKADVDLFARLRLDHAMRTALGQEQYRLHYQPQVEIRTNRVIGVEALIRWTDPGSGPVSPAHFIPVAEETGFIVALGQWVFTEAVRQAAQWLEQGIELPVSINVSAAQFQQKRFVEQVAFTLTTWGLPSRLVEIELTESILVGEGDEVYHRLTELAGLGVRLAIDDFGTGYSNLAYLKRFPISRLKIDRSFVDELPDDESDMAITRAVIHLGHALNLQVIAEGVETNRQLGFLQGAGCDEYQGWLHSRALPPDEVIKLLDRPAK